MEAIDYTIGDDIVCIKSHSQGVVKEGQIYKCLGLRITPCGCSYLVNVGIEDSTNYYITCRSCGKKYDADEYWWINSSLFRSIDKISISEVYEQLDKQPFEV